MGLQWIAIDKNLPRHPKSLDLADALDEQMAWARIAAMWMWVGDYYPDGRVSCRDPARALERAAGWAGEPGRLVEAAVECGFIDRDGQVLVMHGWDEHQGGHIAKAERDAERLRQKRAAVARPSRDESATRARPSQERSGPVAGERRREEKRGDLPPPPTPSAPGEPATPAVAVVADTQGAQPPDDVVDALWARLQLQRVDAELHAEARPPKRFRAWALATWGSLGPEPLERLAYAHRRFLADEAFRDRAWPTAVFIAGEVWATRVPAPLPRGAA